MSDTTQGTHRLEVPQVVIVNIVSNALGPLDDSASLLALGLTPGCDKAKAVLAPPLTKLRVLGLSVSVKNERHAVSSSLVTVVTGSASACPSELLNCCDGDGQHTDCIEATRAATKATEVAPVLIEEGAKLTLIACRPEKLFASRIAQEVLEAVATDLHPALVIVLDDERIVALACSVAVLTQRA